MPRYSVQIKAFGREIVDVVDAVDDAAAEAIVRRAKGVSIVVKRVPTAEEAVETYLAEEARS